MQGCTPAEAPTDKQGPFAWRRSARALSAVGGASAGALGVWVHGRRLRPAAAREKLSIMSIACVKEPRASGSNLQGWAPRSGWGCGKLVSKLAFRSYLALLRKAQVWSSLIDPGYPGRREAQRCWCWCCLLHDVIRCSLEASLTWHLHTRDRNMTATLCEPIYGVYLGHAQRRAFMRCCCAARGTTSCAARLLAARAHPR